MGTPLEPVKVPLKGFPFLWWVICMTQLGVISIFAEGALHSISEGWKGECPPSDLGAAKITGREETLVSTSTLMQKSRCCCWVVLKFLFCSSLPVLAKFLLTSHCLGNFNWNQEYWQLFQLPSTQDTKILHTSSYYYSPLGKYKGMKITFFSWMELKHCGATQFCKT